MTFYNYFTSFDVANSLLQNGVTVVDNMKRNKRSIPQCFLSSRTDLEINMFEFGKTVTPVSYLPRKNRVVIFLSTMHHTSEVNTENKNNSEINLYNATEGDVDILHQMSHGYTVRRKANR